MRVWPCFERPMLKWWGVYLNQYFADYRRSSPYLVAGASQQRCFDRGAQCQARVFHISYLEKRLPSVIDALSKYGFTHPAKSC